MRFVRNIALAVLGVLLGAVAAAGGYGLATAPARPDLKPLLAKASSYDVRIRRDRYGVPHILGRTDPDAAFGLAFAHAEDDFATIQEVTLAVRGDLAASNGAKAAPGDYLVRLLGVWQTVDTGYDRDLPADVRAVLQAYADGINYYGALHPEAVKPGFLPVSGKDIAAGFVFKTPFFYGLDSTLKELSEARPDKTPVGSNGVAVAPSRSADGATRLLVNSHQPYTGPVAWWEAVVESGQGWHVAGGFFPGSPFMLHGHNAHLGWANTVNNPDLIDVYRLTVNDKGQYRLDGRWVDFQKSTAVLRVKLWGPFAIPVRMPVLRSVHGPVMKTKAGYFALRYAGMGEVRQPLQYWRLDKAENLEQWKAAMALQALPSINYVYADEKGNIGYVYNGLFPERAAGPDWSGVLPGDRGDLVWTRYLPFDRVPQLWNPAGGLVFNANNTPFAATTANDGLKAQDFPAWMGIQTNMTNRSYREQETFGADSSITPEEFATYKFDIAYSRRSEVGQMLAALSRVDPGQDLDLAKALLLLARWDLRASQDSRAAALALFSAQAIHDAKEDGKVLEPAAALRQAMNRLKLSFGRIDPTWGEVNRIRRGSVDLGIDGGPDTLRAVYGKPDAKGRLEAMAGDTFIMFVSWDRYGVLSSKSIHQFGSATLDKGSRHYADQTPLFVKEQLKPVLFTEAQLAGNIEADYRPGQRR
ncbi:penicillin amidase/acyl-homoserine-lactone acylase [Caulobacter ginsengisoli]|uniref:Penicillin amidase/acyl-homoserine-lactone acylase n=1 Tax=Caulobacter ginsengisoli TaxID=400775 RepID=A0ABU0INU1_9CAUL|nr:acylase [Caulobacter ginsengisoli]MDQ0463675.1 penicillin amidase/acyl-homoserine-lactone acylase [Caulobacter ginsengisoli]